MNTDAYIDKIPNCINFLNKIYDSTEEIENMVLLTAEIDLTFIALVITVLAGIFVLIRSIRNFFQIGSQEYLLISIFFFNLAFYAFYRMWAEYLSFDRIWWATQDNSFWDAGLIYFISNTAWGLGIIALLLHIYRLINWKKQHIIIKACLITILVEGILEAIYYSIFHLIMFITRDWGRFYPNWYVADELILQFWVLRFFFQTTQGALVFFLTVMYLVLAISYVTLKPVINSRNIKISRIVWIFFSLVSMLKWFAFLSFENEFNLFSSLPFFQELRSLWIDYDIFEILETISLVSLMTVVGLYPESLLITEYQILKAKKLYSIIQRNKMSEENTQLDDINISLKNYIQLLPFEIISHLKSIE